MKKEGSCVKFRGKRFVYEKEWTPSCGIQLVKDAVEFQPLLPAKQRTENLKLDLIFLHLETKLYPLLSFVDKLAIQSNWDWIRDKLEGIERSELPTMKITDLPRQSNDTDVTVRLPENLNELLGEEEIPDLIGCKFPDVAIDGSLEADFVVGQDLVIWTEVKESRLFSQHHNIT